MSKTFYIASAGIPEQRVRVQQLADRLRREFGWRWHGGWDWTRNYGEAKGRKLPMTALSYRAVNDRTGARDCDVFIFWEIEHTSKGANREYGVRWGRGDDVYHLCETEIHLFDTVEHVYTIQSVEDLVWLLRDRECA